MSRLAAVAVLAFALVAAGCMRDDAPAPPETTPPLVSLRIIFPEGFTRKQMAERNMQEAQAAKSQVDDYVRSVATEGGAAAEIERAKKLLDSGTISQAEFDAIKQKALA